MTPIHLCPDCFIRGHMAHADMVIRQEPWQHPCECWECTGCNRAVQWIKTIRVMPREG